MERAWEGVAILMDDVWHSAVIKFKFSSVKICVEVGYNPSEGYGEERDRFWNDKDRILDRVGN